MQTLTAMTLGALILGAAAFAYDAASAGEPLCAGREVSVYFEKGKSEINEFSKAVVERVAAEAKACGIDTVVADTKVDSRRTAAITEAFEPLGVKVVVAGNPPSAPASGDFIADRAATVRLTMNRDLG
jgi:ABC-type sugar transport system substrate-binding protein